MIHHGDHPVDGRKLGMIKNPTRQFVEFLSAGHDVYIMHDKRGDAWAVFAKPCNTELDKT